MRLAFLSSIVCSIFSCIFAQNWWNKPDLDNKYREPDFRPGPNQRFTHYTPRAAHSPRPNDVLVHIPKAGFGMFVGFSQSVNYDYTWTEWPPIQGRLVNCFLGIPYAAPPLQRLRFQNSIPAFLDTRFVWMARQYKPACLQPTEYMKRHMRDDFNQFSEDCLYLNVFYPNRTWERPDTRYPVVVFLHGGEFAHGSSHLYPGHALASQGLVVVTLNYRLGPLGFVSLGSFAALGNYGLWDQQLAMTWVRDNIAWFRGDPSRITLMGHGAGAVSAGIHLVSPAVRGRDLFHRAVLMSGSDLQPGGVADAVRVRMREYTKRLARALGCTGEEANHSVYALIMCLRYYADAQRLVDVAYSAAVTRERGDPYPRVWRPVVDGSVGILPRTPRTERDRLGGALRVVATTNSTTSTRSPVSSAKRDKDSSEDDAAERAGDFVVPIMAGVVHSEASHEVTRLIADWFRKTLPPVNPSSRNRIELDTAGAAAHAKPFVLQADEFDEFIRLYLTREMKLFRAEQTVEELRFRYAWWPDLANRTARVERLIALLSDYRVNEPVESALRAQHTMLSRQWRRNHKSISTDSPQQQQQKQRRAQPDCFFYEWAFRSRLDQPTGEGGTTKQQQMATDRIASYGVYHGVEIPFVFGFPFMNWRRRRAVNPYERVKVVTPTKPTQNTTSTERPKIRRPDGHEDQTNQLDQSEYLPLPYAVNAAHDWNYPFDTNMSEFAMMLWHNFAEIGNPTPWEIQNVTWLPYRQSEPRYLNLYINSSMREAFRPDHLAFWRTRFQLLADPLSAFTLNRFYPMYAYMKATWVMGGLLLALIICIVTLTTLIMRRRKPAHYKLPARLKAGDNFSSAFQDSFAGYGQIRESSRL